MWIGLGLELLGSFEEKKANNGANSLLYSGPIWLLPFSIFRSSSSVPSCSSPANTFREFLHLIDYLGWTSYNLFL